MLPDRSFRSPGAGAVLQHLLEEPALVETVRKLDPPVLAALVRHVGLEDAGEIVALATPAQLTQLLDDDVWTSKHPGEKESFDARRFVIWTEIFLESGPTEAAHKLADLDETFLAMAFAQLLRVFDSDLLGTRYSDASEDPEDRTRFDKALEGSPYYEIDTYLVVGRSQDGWDALIDVLTSLDEIDHRLFCRLMDRCLQTTEHAADQHGGIGALLRADEALFEDAAAKRDERRARQGFVEPVTAKTLLRVVARESVEDVLAEQTLDPVIASYLRDYPPEPSATEAAASPGTWAAQLKALLAQAEPEAAAPPRKRLTSGEAPGARLVALFQALRTRNVQRYDAAKAELTFWANVLVAGDASHGRALRPREAAEQVLAACERGLTRLSERDPARAERALDEPHGVAFLYRLGSAKG